ncbi:unnamed protein product [Ilex paraguariensis]|uniref:Peroxidase n=1 Tax=Ilex paraguariensis TaxID=185542 RepID=A0ABC8QNH9_9AQUA
MGLPALNMLICNGKVFLLALILCYLQFGVSEGQLKVGFYSQTCPNVESIVKTIVRDATLTNPRMAPMLLRLHFHDCFVEGCDGSILIDNVEDPEKRAFGHQGLGGFAEIENAKAKLEAECPGVVSCADIVALAARDAIVLSGGLSYQVETGRRDGRVSSESLAADMPDVNDPIQTLKSKFMNKGLSEKELVLLTGAHTIGTTACFFMSKRLYNFTGINDADPEINPDFLPSLRTQCLINGNVNIRIPLDALSNEKFDDQSLRNIKNGTAVLASDARLYDDSITKQVIDSYVGFLRPVSGPLFVQDFPMAMVKMGRIGVKTGLEGEIRRICSSFN